MRRGVSMTHHHVAVVYVRFCHEDNKGEEMLFIRILHETTNGEDIFIYVMQY